MQFDFQTLTFLRPDTPKRSPLIGYDGAQMLMLDWLYENAFSKNSEGGTDTEIGGNGQQRFIDAAKTAEGAQILVVNDRFGVVSTGLLALTTTALALPELATAGLETPLGTLQEPTLADSSQKQAETPLTQHEVLPKIVFWSDSARSRRGLKLNLQANALSSKSALIEFVAGDQDPLGYLATLNRCSDAGYSDVAYSNVDRSDAGYPASKATSNGENLEQLPKAVLCALLIPKSLELLEYQLKVLQPLRAEATFVAAGLARHLTPNVRDLLGRYSGEIDVSRARRKARIVTIVAQSNPLSTTLETPTGKAETVASTLGKAETNESVDKPASAKNIKASKNPEASFGIQVGGMTLQIADEPGVFSAKRLDNASRLLIETVAENPQLFESSDLFDNRYLADSSTVENPNQPQAIPKAIDLGCGAGVLAIAVEKMHPGRFEWTLSDVSDLAVKAAKRSWQINHRNTTACFMAQDGLENNADSSAALVVTNPPFHQDHAIDLHLTERVIVQSARVLQSGGVMLAVVQRHHEVHKIVRRYFAKQKALSKHRDYVVLQATCPSPNAKGDAGAS